MYSIGPKNTALHIGYRPHIKASKMASIVPYSDPSWKWLNLFHLGIAGLPSLESKLHAPNRGNGVRDDRTSKPGSASPKSLMHGHGREAGASRRWCFCQTCTSIIEVFKASEGSSSKWIAPSSFL